jgi:molybdopterin converting factor small subunit
VRVNFFATYRPIVGGRHLEVPLEPGSTVGDLIDWLAERFPEFATVLRDDTGGLSRQTHVFVDGRGVTAPRRSTSSPRWRAARARPQTTPSDLSFASGTTPSCHPRRS